MNNFGTMNYTILIDAAFTEIYTSCTDGSKTIYKQGKNLCAINRQRTSFHFSILPGEQCMLM